MSAKLELKAYKNSFEEKVSAKVEWKLIRAYLKKASAKVEWKFIRIYLKKK